MDKLHECYTTMYKELINGQVRANDDLRIIIYECAIRSIANELNTIIPYNGQLLNDERLNSKEIINITKSGINVLLKDHNETYLYLGSGFNYPFLKEIDKSQVPKPLKGIIDNEKEPFYTADKDLSRLNKNRIKSNRPCLNSKVLGWVNDGSVDYKEFLKIFPDVLEANSKQKKIANSTKVVNMFYAYDEYTFNKKMLGEIRLAYQPDGKIDFKAEKTNSNWIKKVETAIKTFRDYYIPTP